MLQDPKYAASISAPGSELRPNDLKIVALFALAALALLFFASNKIEIPGDPEYPTTFYVR